MSNADDKEKGKDLELNSYADSPVDPDVAASLNVDTNVPAMGIQGASDPALASVAPTAPTQSVAPQDTSPQNPGLTVAPQPAPSNTLPVGASDTQAFSPQPKPEPNTIDIIGKLPPAQNALQRTAENGLVAQDMASGKIVPQTYQSLFDNKSTLGKIGTIFGLIVSGAGSGLSHQPNALMEMMNKQIQNDLDAQKNNQANKQTWYNSALQHEKNLAEIEHTNAVAQAVRMGTYSKALEADLQKYSLSTLPGIIDMSASTNAKNNMMSSAIQDQQNNINRLAPGPAKDRQQITLDTVIKPAAEAQITKNNLDYANKKAAIDALHPNPLKSAIQPIDPRGAVINQKAFEKGIQLGKVAPLAPGAISPSQQEKINSEAKDVAINRNNYADYVDSFKKLSNLKFGGQVPAGGTISSVVGALPFMGQATNALNDAKSAFERERNIQVEALKNRIGANVSEEDKNKQINAMLPSWNDNENTMSEAYRKGTQHFSSNPAESSQTLKYFNLGIPFQAVPYKSWQNDADFKKESQMANKSSPNWIDNVSRNIFPSGKVNPPTVAGVQ